MDFKHTATMEKLSVNPWDWSEMFYFLQDKYPERVLDFAQSFSENQFVSKSWLVEQIRLHDISDKKNLNINIMGSWYGTLLVPLLFKYLNIGKITLIDFDEETIEIARFLFRRYERHRIDFVVKDLSFDFEPMGADININTSCEHMVSMKELKPKGLCVFQTNNFKKELSHINCADSIEHFKEQCDFKSVDYEGEIAFHRWDDEHLRFMLIGKYQ